MLSISNISTVRQTLTSLVKNLKKPVVIVQNSTPKAVLLSYEQFSELYEKTEETESKNTDFEYMVMDAGSFEYDADEQDNFQIADVQPL